MCISPIWYTILQKEHFTDVRYYYHIYPTIHRLVFEEGLEIDLQVVKGRIETASIWKRPAPYEKKNRISIRKYRSELRTTIHSQRTHF